MKRLLFLQGVNQGGVLIKAGEFAYTENADGERLCAENQFIVDLTPKYICGATGIFQDRLHARFWIDLCRCKHPGAPLRMTRCPFCNDSGRMVIA